MRTLQVSRDIVPMAELKAQTSKIFRKMHDDQRPIVVTQNGRPACVLLTPAEFDRMQEQARFLAKIQAGLADAEAGRSIDDETLSAQIEAEFG